MSAGLLVTGFIVGWTAIQPTVPEPRKPAAYELEWDAPAGCPDQAAMEARIAALAEDASGGDGVMLVRGRVEQGETGFVGTIVTEYDGRVDERSVDSADCEAVADATALVVAVALVPELEEQVQERPSASVPEPGATTSSVGVSPGAEPLVVADVVTTTAEPQPTVEPVADARPRRRRPPTAIALRLGPRIEFGGLPRVAPGMELAAGLLWPRWRAEVFGTYLFPRAADPQATEGVYQLGSAGVRGCHRFFAGPVELPLCGGLEGGVMRVDSQDPQPQQTLFYPWLAPSVASGIGFSGPRVGLLALAELGVPALWSRVTIAGETVHLNRPVSIRGTVSLEIKFGLEPR